MKWIGSRISCVDDKDRTTIVIHPERIVWKNSLLLAWFSMWIFIGIYIVAQLNQTLTKEQKLILIVFLCFWVYFAYRVGKAVFWQFWGKELIMIDKVAMSYKKSIFKFGKATPYYLENIKKLRVDEVKETSLGFQFENSLWIVGGERLSFDNIGKTHRFGRKLDQKDATLLFKYIAKRLDTFLKKNK